MAAAMWYASASPAGIKFGKTLLHTARLALASIVIELREIGKRQASVRRRVEELLALAFGDAASARNQMRCWRWSVACWRVGFGRIICGGMGILR
jgi:hypothetical protein